MKKQLFYVTFVALLSGYLGATSQSDLNGPRTPVVTASTLPVSVTLVGAAPRPAITAPALILPAPTTGAPAAPKLAKVLTPVLPPAPPLSLTVTPTVKPLSLIPVQPI